VKQPLITVFAGLLALSACRPFPPEISLPEVPAREFVSVLEQRRGEFRGLTALASVTMVRKGRKRVYESVGIVVDRRNRFRIEAYGPLGEAFLTLIWDGAEVLVRTEDGRVMQPGAAGIEKLIGPGISPSEFASILIGNVPAFAGMETRTFCGGQGLCVTQFRSGDVTRRVRTVSSPAGISVTGYEVYRKGDLLFSAAYRDIEPVSGYDIPRTVIIEQPAHAALLTVTYSDMDANAPAGDAPFALSGGEAPLP
jgi:hypothetical protein